MGLTEKKRWRIIPILAALFCAILVLKNILMPRASFPEGDFVTQKPLIFFNSLTMLAFIYLAIKPRHVYVYTIICTIQCFLNIVDGGNIIGMLFLFLGLSIAFRQGFFKTRAKIKIAFFSLILLAAFLFQIRFGISTFLSSVLRGILVLFMFAFYVVLFNEYLKELLPKKTTRTIDLSIYQFTENECDYIRRVLRSEKYAYIAQHHAISESAIKQRMNQIYRKIGVTDRTSFLLMCQNANIIFPKNAKIRDEQ